MMIRAPVHRAITRRGTPQPMVRQLAWDNIPTLTPYFSNYYHYYLACLRGYKTCRYRYSPYVERLRALDNYHNNFSLYKNQILELQSPEGPPCLHKHPEEGGEVAVSHQGLAGAQHSGLAALQPALGCTSFTRIQGVAKKRLSRFNTHALTLKGHKPRSKYKRPSVKKKAKQFYFMFTFCF